MNWCHSGHLYDSFDFVYEENPYFINLVCVNNSILFMQDYFNIRRYTPTQRKWPVENFINSKFAQFDNLATSNYIHCKHKTQNVTANSISDISSLLLYCETYQVHSKVIFAASTCTLLLFTLRPLQPRKYMLLLCLCESA